MASDVRVGGNRIGSLVVRSLMIKLVVKLDKVESYYLPCRHSSIIALARTHYSVPITMITQLQG